VLRIDTTLLSTNLYIITQDKLILVVAFGYFYLSIRCDNDNSKLLQVFIGFILDTLIHAHLQLLLFHLQLPYLLINVIFNFPCIARV